MTTKPLERVARAIVDAEREFRGSEPIRDDEWRNYWSPGGPAAMPSLIAMRAKAALVAIREPSELMIVAADEAANGYADHVWHLMIDAALEEG